MTTQESIALLFRHPLFAHSLPVKSPFVCFLRVSLFCALLCCERGARADDFMWIQTPGPPIPSFDWSIPTNWTNLSMLPTSVTGIPGAGDTALFTDLYGAGMAPYPVLFDPLVPPSNITVAQVTVESGIYNFSFLAPDPVAALTVTGTDGLVIGRGSNTATLSVENIGPPGSIAANGTIIGRDGGATGILHLGPLAWLYDASDIRVGYDGSGLLIVDPSAFAVSETVLRIAQNAGSYGEARVDGSVQTMGQILVASSPTALAYINVGGGAAGAQLFSDSFIHLGDGGEAHLAVFNGGTVSVSTAFQIGTWEGSTGEATVSDPNSILKSVWYLNVGNWGQGTLIVGSGGTASTSGDLAVAVHPGSQGTVNINDGGTVSAGANAHVGGGGWQDPVGGTGVMTVNSGGTLNVTGTLEVVSSAAANSVNLNGGTINTAGLNFNGTPSLLNWTAGTLHLTSSASFDSAAAPDTTSAAFGSALTLGTGQTLQITGTATLGGAGAFSLTVNSGGTVEADNLIVSSLGELHGDGDVVANVQNSGLVSPGTSPGTLTIDGDFTQSAGGELLVELGSDTMFDRLDLSGAASLDGLLTISLIDLGGGLFAPEASDSFAVLSATTLSGEFDNVADQTRLTTFGGEGSFLVDYDAVLGTVTLSGFISATALLGDYNGNGQVDAADYTAWRDALSAGATTLANDPTPGVVDENDFNYWRAHFGETLGSGAGAASLTAVPEPSSALLLCIGMLGVAGLRNWFHSLGRSRALGTPCDMRLPAYQFYSQC